MQVVYHLGVHCTDEERLLRCLLKNRGALAAEGIAVPGPARYRTLLRDTAMSLRGAPAPAQVQATLLEQIMAQDAADRLVLSWDNFMGYAQGAVRASLYPSAGERMRAFRGVFPDAPTEFHLAVRNPATFVPALIQKQRARAPDEPPRAVDVAKLRWSDLVASLRAHNPDVPVTIWCDEDTPLIWPEVLRAVCGHSDALTLEETDDLLASIMSPDGFARMQAYLDSHPPQGSAQRRRIVSAFLDKFVVPEEVEVALDMPDWTEDTVTAATRDYDQDMARIMGMEGVRFLAP